VVDVDILSENDELSSLLLGPAIEVKLLDTALDAGLVEGYASVFGGVDAYGDSVVPGAFQESITKHNAAGTSPPMLWHHRSAEPVGRWLGMGEDARGLRVRGQLNLDTSRGRDAHAHLKAGDISGLSIGYQVAPGGQERVNGTRVLKKLILHEVSLTATPADPGARVTAVKALHLKSRADAEDLLQNCGLSRAASRKFVSGGWAALVGEETPPTDPALVELGRRLDAALLNLKSLKRR
jgi:HK97 family phage prohead protease